MSIVKRIISLVMCVVLLIPLSTNMCDYDVFATQSRKGNFSQNFTLTGNGADDIVAVARAQLGKTGSQLGYSEQWCADFVSDCADLAGQSVAVPRDGYCPNLRTKIVNAGGTYVSTYTAQKGDIVFYGNNGAEHVEIVYAASNGVVSTIGGNSGSSKSLLYRAVKDHSTQTKPIAYIVRPNYKTTSQTPQQADLGTDFYAFITNAYSGLDATLIDDNIVLKKEMGTANQIFKFVKQLDGSYAIYDCKYGLAMDVEDGLAEKKTNVCAYRWQNNSNQKWYIYGNEKYTIKAGCTLCVLNPAWGGVIDGTNVDMDEDGDKEWQKWYILKLPNIGSPQLCVEVNKNNVTFSWQEAKNATGYSLKILRGNESVYTRDNINDLKHNIQLKKGTYTAYIDAYNEYSYIKSNVVEFVVEDEETIEESSTEIVTTTPYVVETTEDNITQQFTTETTSDVLQTTTNETTNQVTIPESTVTENITETETEMESEQQTTQETNQTSTEGLVTDESESARDNLTTQQTSQKISDKVTEHNKKRKNLVTVKIKKVAKKGLKSKKINLSFKKTPSFYN